MRPEIVIIGSGNVATHLAHAFQNAGCHIAQVYSRSLDHASRLASELKDCQPVDDLSSLTQDADLYLVSAADASVAPIAEAIHKVKGIVAHTSGSVPLAALSPASHRTAVLYPLQTFTRDAIVDIANVPFFTEASDRQTLEDIDAYARMLSEKVYHADSDKRKTLHIAGVLSCNFVNYLWDCTAQVLGADGYDFSVVEPLVRATLDKAVAIGPRAAQTGPAMRCDADVMRQHIDRLDPDKARIYRELSNEIMKTHKLDCKL